MAAKKSNSNTKEFCQAVETALGQLADASKAPAMRAYMRDKFVYLGITTPQRREATKVLIRASAPVEAAALRAAAFALWEMEEREYQYVAADLLNKHEDAFSLEDLPWLLDLVQSKPWWDTVDCFYKVIRGVVLRSGTQGRRAMDFAVKNDDMWMRRIAMLHQIGIKSETDTVRLFKYADLLASDRDFFIRKAVGWALRDYAWHDWRAVEKYLKGAGDRLSGLSVREAKKNFATLKKQG
jgi:3-methyladenine DNA glycosylase AlkD